jgi:uncharacterized membrane protein
MSSPDLDDLTHVAAAERRKVKRDLRQTLLSGIALTVPFLVTVLILTWALDMVSTALTPLVEFLVAVTPLYGTDTLLVQGLAFALVFGLIFVVGLAAQHGPETHLGRRMDMLMEDVPGLGSIYTSVERMSDVLLEGDTDSFQEVRVVEFPEEGSFAIGFLTADDPTVVEEAVGEDGMVTVFVPMAPNPVMGGHLLTLRPERLYEVDLSVEEGMQAIMTTGVTIEADVDEQPA